MKLTEAPIKIIGVQMGEASLNLMREGVPPLKAKVALISKDGEPCGYMDIAHGWSEKTIEALRALTSAVEEDALARIAEQQPKSETPTTEEQKGPQQF